MTSIEIVGRPAVLAAPKDDAVAGAVVFGERLRSPGQAVQDVLRTQVGIQVVESGGLGAPATASIRGSTAAQTPVYLGGVRVNDEVGGAADLSQVPLWLLQRIEIYRGHAPLDADRLGLGGAVFLEPRRPARPEGSVGSLAGSFGTRATWGHVGTTVSALGRPMALLVGAQAEASRNDYDYPSDPGTLFVPGDERTETRRNADVGSLSGWVLARTLGGRGHHDVMLHGAHREQGVPRLALSPSRWARASFARTLIAWRTEQPLDARGRSVFEAMVSVLIGRSALHDPMHELERHVEHLVSDGVRTNSRLGLRWRSGARLSWRSTLDVGEESLRRHEGGIEQSGSARRDLRVALTADVTPLRWLTLRPLLALEHHATDLGVGRGEPSRQTEPVGRLSALVRPFGGFEAFAAAGRYLRVPTLGELYGISMLVRGNPHLDPERGTSFELGIRWFGEAGDAIQRPFLEVTGFVRQADDMVGYARSAPGYVTAVNLRSARVSGLEMRAAIGLLRWFSADLALTVLDPRDTSPDHRGRNDLLPYQSRLVVVPRLRAELPGAGHLRRPAAEIRWFYQSSRYADFAGLAVLPEQSSLDLEASVVSFEHLTTRLRLGNLLDTPRFDVVGYPLPGRSVFVSLEATW